MRPARPSFVATALLAAAALSVSPLVAAAQTRPALTTGDYGRWERLGQTTLSDDGRWLAAEIGRVNEENELRVRPVSNPDSVIAVPFGSGARFSADGRWVAYSIGLSEDSRKALEKQKKPAHDALGLVDLRSGVSIEIADVASFAFSSDGAHLAMRRYPPPGERDAQGVDLVVRDLASATDINFGNVASYAWNDDVTATPLLAMIVDAEGRAGNGVQLFQPSTGRLRTLDAAPSRYAGLAWREKAADLAVFRTLPDDAAGEEAWADTANVVLAFTGLDGSPGVARVLDPTATPGFPSGHRIVPWEELRWSEDGAAIFLGIRERTPGDTCPEAESGEGSNAEPGDGSPAEVVQGGPSTAAGPGAGTSGDAGCAGDDEEGEDDEPTVEIWHARDVDIVPTQKVRADQDRRDNHLSVWRPATGAFVHLENELTESVRLVGGADTAAGLDQTPYEANRMFGPVFNDIYLVDLANGERTRVLDRIEYFTGMSPGGRYLLWLEDDHYWTYDTRTGQRACLTADLETSFVNLEDDHPVAQKPPFGIAGWLEGDAAVLINDKHDVWRVAPDGSGGERVTWGADANVRHRYARTDGEFDDPIDPTQPIYFSVYDDWAEAWGYARAPKLGDRPATVAWGDARYSGLVKADDAEVYAYRVESFEDSPDYFVASNGELRTPRRITSTNPFQADFAWGRAELLEFDNSWGDHLQGSLYYPANYEPGRRYPMIVYIYEIRSNAVRSYHVPSQRSYYDFQGWVQNGYFVWQPDIVYRDRDPGVSAIASIVPSVEAVVATGMVDPARVGLIGHSWGGYQTTFAVTQTDIFAAAVAGAPLTNLFSMYLSVYWNSGGTDARIFEISQGRMEVPFWKDEDAYRRNSPVFHIENMTTPLLMAQGTEDGAVDFNQGVEFYNAARREGKDFVFLVYNDENHGFRQKSNQLDYHRRIMEWFGHYLKGEPAADWIREGVPYLAQPGGRAPSAGGRR